MLTGRAYVNREGVTLLRCRPSTARSVLRLPVSSMGRARRQEMSDSKEKLEAPDDGVALGRCRLYHREARGRSAAEADNTSVGPTPRESRATCIRLGYAI